MHCIFALGTDSVKIVSEDLGLDTNWMANYVDIKGNQDIDVIDPVLINIDSPKITGDMRGWLIDRLLELERPAKASVTVTPEFAR